VLTNSVIVLTNSVIMLIRTIIVLTYSIEVLTHSIVLVFPGLRRAPPRWGVRQHVPLDPAGTPP
jgi:hypothetical protein